MPEFHFGGWQDVYSEKDNSITMEPKGITPYRIGCVGGKFLYHAINPDVFIEKDKLISSYVQSLNWPNPMPALSPGYAWGNAYLNLITMTEHYCGLCYDHKTGGITCADSCDLMVRLCDSSGDPDSSPLARIEADAHFCGMWIAERLFDDYPPDQFKRLIQLSFSEARERLLHMTGINLLGEHHDYAENLDSLLEQLDKILGSIENLSPGRIIYREET